jgi:hypothetical protein
MATNRVQFQRGLSMREFEQLYGTEERCEQALMAWRWPEGFRCPRCGGGQRTQFRRGRLLYLQCGQCQYQCSLIAGTIFGSTKLALKVWFTALHLLAKAKTNVSALELSRDLGVRYRSAWMVKHKLMETMRLREADRRLVGRVEIDDAFLGGERTGGKPGRGSENKVAFVAAVQTDRRCHPQLVCLSARAHTKEALRQFAQRSLGLPLTLISDGLGCFQAAAGFATVHEPTTTGGGAAAAKVPQLLWVNTVLGNLKTGLSGAYHAFKFKKYAPRYLAEFQYRFNRRFDLQAIMRHLASAAIATRPHPERRLRVAEDST